MRHRFELIVFQLLKWFVLSLPLKSAQRLGAVLGTVAFYLIGGRKRIALENLRHAFPEKSEPELLTITKGAFKNYGIAFIELLWIPNFNKVSVERLYSSTTTDVLLNAEAEGRGLIFLTGHFGSWELTPVISGLLLQKPFHIIVQTQSNKLVDEVINNHRRILGNETFDMGMQIREILRALDKKEVIAIAADQSGAQEGAYVEFFGRVVSTHKGPAVFALKNGAPIVMMFLVRQSDLTYKAVYNRIPMDNLPANKDEAIVELTRRHTNLLEQYIRQYPDHWLWMHRRWKHVQEQPNS
ncbi:MAG: lysophospholipid acyltransferase family protein [Ignavibacteriae bacterium]|nr:lysophospholipid acyltransferase family protein [Ignavibacteriota bacterium]